MEEEQELTLEEVRKRAQERMKGICTANKVCDGGPQRLCQGQKYGGSLGLGGKGKGLAFTNNVSALDKIKLKTRLITEHFEPDMTAEFYGREIGFPIMASSTSGVNASMGGSIPEYDFALAVLQGSKDAGTIGYIGNTAMEDPVETQIKAVGSAGLGVNIFKPQANDRIIGLMNKAEEAGAVAVGVDLDGVTSANWAKVGNPLFRKSVSDLQELVDSTSLPFIAKGIMCSEDALNALDAGVQVIDVSNHGGRALESTPGVADVLPGIAEDVNNRVILTAGGGVRTGYDILKMLALGADAVLLGRDIIRAAIGGGAEGVKLHFDYVAAELRNAMTLAGTASIDEI